MRTRAPPRRNHPGAAAGKAALRNGPVDCRELLLGNHRPGPSSERATGRAGPAAPRAPSQRAQARNDGFTGTEAAPRPADTSGLESRGLAPPRARVPLLQDTPPPCRGSTWRRPLRQAARAPLRARAAITVLAADRLPGNPLPKHSQRPHLHLPRAPRGETVTRALLQKNAPATPQGLLGNWPLTAVHDGERAGQRKERR